MHPKTMRRLGPILCCNDAVGVGVAHCSQFEPVSGLNGKVVLVPDGAVCQKANADTFRHIGFDIRVNSTLSTLLLAQRIAQSLY